MTPLAFIVACSLGFHDFVPIRTDHEGVALPREVVGRVGSMRFRHSGEIQQLVATPDGSRCVTRTSDNVVTVWEIRTGRRLAQHFFPKHEVQAIATDDTHITIVLTDNRGWYCRRIEIVSGRIVAHRRLDHEADKVAFSATGDRLVVRLGALFEVQESVTGKILHSQRFSISDFVPDEMVLAPNGKSVAARFKDWLEVIDVKTGHTLLAVSLSQTEKEQYEGIAYSEDCDRIILKLSHPKYKCIDSIPFSTRQRTTILKFRKNQHEEYCHDWKIDSQGIWIVHQHHLARYDLAGKLICAYRIPVEVFATRDCDILTTQESILIAERNFGISVFNLANRRWLWKNLEQMNKYSPVQSFSDDGTSLLQIDHNTIVQSDWVTGTLDHIKIFAAPKQIKLMWGATIHQSRFAMIDSRNRVAIRQWPTGEVDRTVVIKGMYQLDAIHLDTTRFRLLVRDEDRLLLFPHDRTQPPEQFRHRALENSRSEFCVSPSNILIFDIDDKSRLTSIHSYQFSNKSWSTCQLSSQFLEANLVQIVSSASLHQFAMVYKKCLLLYDARAQSIVAEFPFEAVSTTYSFRVSYTHDSRSLILANASSSVGLSVVETASQRIRHRFRSYYDQGYIQLFPDHQGHYFGTYSDGHAVQIWDFRGRHAGYPTSLTLAELERLWTQLLDNDAELAFQALRRLAAAPNSTIPFVRDRVAPAVASPKLATLLIDLESPNFAVRDAATRELMRFADVHGPELTKARRETTSADVRTRLDRIMASATYGSPTLVRRERIIELLDWCGTPDAMAHLQKLANGLAGAGLTESARSTLANRRP